MTTQILVVDDDVELLGSLADFLGREGMAVSVLHEVKSLGEHIKRDPPDLIVLDQIMQGLNGLAALSILRAAGNNVPVILTSGPDDTDRIVGLETGADDCICKPFNPRELLARMRAVLRRQTLTGSGAAQKEHKVVGFGPFTLDLQLRALNMENRRLTLSAGEFALLKVFVNNPMRTLTRERLLELLHGPEDGHTDRGIDVQVWRLRRILEANPSTPRFIQTVRSHGYVFVPDGAQHSPKH
ncbi:response regulator [Paraburkholderia domus]|uniref:response regulator n=1 Tax=Paraburkholderia domus TaxID=2793075 RepID=UPI001B2B990A|nr:response regulator [Paraburkholderia domus]CAE6732815.1 Transcriptional regulatory protein OmpR [Paraburkholderia domus]